MGTWHGTSSYLTGVGVMTMTGVSTFPSFNTQFLVLSMIMGTVLEKEDGHKPLNTLLVALVESP